MLTANWGRMYDTLGERDLDLLAAEAGQDALAELVRGPALGLDVLHLHDAVEEHARVAQLDQADLGLGRTVVAVDVGYFRSRARQLVGQRALDGGGVGGAGDGDPDRHAERRGGAGGGVEVRV